MKNTLSTVLVLLIACSLHSEPLHYQRLSIYPAVNCRNINFHTDTGKVNINTAVDETAAFSGVNLPLMIIKTNGKTIERGPRIKVDMGLIYNGEGKLTKISDPWN